MLILALNWRRRWHPTPVLLPGKSHGQRSLVGCSPWGREESDMTEPLHFHFSLSCTGEGNGNPLQYSCLENPRDRSLVSCHLWGHTELDTTDVTQQQQQHLTTKIKKKKRYYIPQQRPLHAATKNQCRHINNIFFLKSQMY